MGKTHLAPGFRFHPTDVELVRYYLKRKVLGKNLMVDAIAELDIYKFEPSDLPDMAYIKGGDLKWHFFCPREKKYSSGARINRATVRGYWKTTGKERPVQCNSEVVGQIRTLVYHVGKSPKGERTDWVMHEYRLEDSVLTQRNIPQDTYVVCVVFKKDGPGPRNGAQYGAPFKEEDWSDDDVVCTDVPAINNTPNLSEPSRETSLAVTTADESNRDCFDGLISDSCVSNVLPTPTTISELPHPSDAVITPMSENDPNQDWCGGLISEPWMSNGLPTTSTISELPHWSDALITPMSANDPNQEWLGGLISEPWVSNGLPTTPSISELPYPSDVANTSALQTTPMCEPLQTTRMSSALQTTPCNNEDIFSMFDLIDNDEEVLGFSGNNEIYSMLDNFNDDDEILGYSQDHFDFTDFTPATNDGPFGFTVAKGHGADK